MKKILIIAILLFSARSFSFGQKNEHITVNWPNEYNWKVAKRESNTTHQLIQIIPGQQDLKSPPIIGSIEAFIGVHFDSIPQIINFFKKGMDVGTQMTIIESMIA